MNARQYARWLTNNESLYTITSPSQNIYSRPSPGLLSIGGRQRNGERKMANTPATASGGESVKGAVRRSGRQRRRAPVRASLLVGMVIANIFVEHVRWSYEGEYHTYRSGHAGRAVRIGDRYVRGYIEHTLVAIRQSFTSICHDDREDNGGYRYGDMRPQTEYIHGCRRCGRVGDGDMAVSAAGR